MGIGFIPYFPIFLFFDNIALGQGCKRPILDLKYNLITAASIRHM